MSAPRRALLTAFTILFFAANAIAQTKRSKADLAARNFWVDSVYNKLSEEERIGQLFMVAAYSGGKNYNEGLIDTLLNAHQVGGLIFMQGGPYGRLCSQTNTST